MARVDHRVVGDMPSYSIGVKMYREFTSHTYLYKYHVRYTIPVLYRFQEYVIAPASELEANEVSLSVSIGLWGGVFPVPAVTTFVTMLLVALLRVSVTQKALAFTFNMLATPLQLLSMPSFILMGNYLFREATCDPMTLLSTFNDPKVSIFTALANSSACLCAGAVVWAILGVPVVYLLTLCLTYLIQRRQQTKIS